VLVSLGLRENISYRLTTPEREAQLTPTGANVAAGCWLRHAGESDLADKTVLRHTLIINLLETARANTRYQVSSRCSRLARCSSPAKVSRCRTSRVTSAS